jgi:CRISPR-associated endonuclease Cas2
MADREILYVFCYDISRDYDRTRVAALLEKELIRVQYSVFEGMLTKKNARRLAESACQFLGETDSLRAYAISKAGHQNSFVYGAGYLPEQEGYYLL